MDDYAGIEFLDKLYQNLYMSDEVQHTKENKDNRKEAIQKYMDRLERVHSKADTEHKKELLEKLYYDKYVIKEDNISDWLNKQDIINTQKKSLKMWLEYLTDNTTSYPMWAKYWAFQGMLKMGSYDESKEIYLKRDKKTMAPFVSANPEIIAKSIETIMKLVNGEEVKEDTLEKINKMDSFNKIYSFFEKKYKKNIIEKSNSNNGFWKKYNQGNREDAIKLSKSLENMNTGWCTASEDMAIYQICGPYNDAPKGGDFYVYYTKDKENKYNIPRIAIRLINNDIIGEIRGIEDGQNLEESMIEVLENKLKEMSFLESEDVNKYLEKVDDLRELTLIGKKTEKNEALTTEELDHLYSKRYGFGWNQDPKVSKIKEKRNILDDYNSTDNKKLKEMFLKFSLLPKGTIIDDKDIVLDAVKSNVSAIIYASEKLLNDKEIMLEAVKQNYFTIELASEELQNDKEILLEAAKQKEKVIEHIKRDYSVFFLSKKFCEDKEIVLEAIKQNYNALRHASKELRNDREVILEAIKQSGYALQFASKELQNDKEIVLEAIKQSGSALQFASKELQNDKEVVLEAIKQNAFALRFASEELQNNPDILKTVGEQEKNVNRGPRL